MGIALERGARGTPSPNPHVGAVVVKGGAGRRRRAPRARGRGPRRGGRAARGRRRARRARRSTSRSSRATTWAARRRAPTPSSRRRWRASSSAAAIPNPHVPAEASSKLRAAGVARRRRAAARPRRSASSRRGRSSSRPGVPYVDAQARALARRAHRVAHGRVEVGHRARGARARPPAARAARRGRSSASARRSPTIRGSPCATRPGRAPCGSCSTPSCACRSPARLVQTARDVPTWVVCTTDAPSSAEEALVERGVEVLRAPPSAEGRIDPLAALQDARHAGHRDRR